MSRARRNLPGVRRSCSPVFAALGDETRLAIVARLSGGASRSISQLTSGTRLSRQAVTKHLRVLERAGIVHGVRAGRESRFQLHPAPFRQAAGYLRQVSGQWDQALARLKAWVEE